MKTLGKASTLGSSNAIASARSTLDRAAKERVAADLHARIFELGEALFQSIGMQLSVQKYKAIGIDRGATLDTIDYPLNNRRWFEERFAAIKNLPEEASRLREIQHILGWTDAGPGGFYDDLGNPARQPHLVRGLDFEQDP